MHIVTGKHIPRRTFLKGMGATVGLPFLDAMVPAGIATGRQAMPGPEQPRLVCIEEVHGSAGCCDWGAQQFLWAPERTGRDFEIIEQSHIAPLAPWRDHLTIVSNTDVRMAEAYTPPEIGGDHFRSTATFLTQSHPRKTQGSDIYVGVSLDQMYAQRFGQDTPIPSMQLCIENLDQAGGCAYGYSCVYTDSLSWAAPNQPLPMARDPRVVFDMLFGAGGTPEERIARRRMNSSILDWIAGQVAQLQREIGAEDRQRIDRYMENIREVERRIQMVEAHNASGEPRELPEAPAGVPDSFREHMELMFDLQVLAFESDVTRVFTFKTGRDAQNRAFPESGSDKPFHPTSHHGNRPEAILEYNTIARYRMSMMPYFLQKLKDSVEGDRSLLDNTLIIWGSPMSDGNVHNHRRCPLLFLGHANGQLPGNLHLKAPEGTPMANPLLSAMHMLGLDDMESFGDSTGTFPLTYAAPAAAVTSSSSEG
jgi:hypothetical protein